MSVQCTQARCVFVIKERGAPGQITLTAELPWGRRAWRVLAPWIDATQKEGEIRAVRVVVWLWEGLKEGRVGFEGTHRGGGGGFFIHFYGHIDKVSSVPSLLGNTATLSWIEL